MKVLAVIPARGNSKGIPRKNVRLMCNRPLISYSITNAKLCEDITDIVVSTDCEEIASISALYGADVIMRDKSLADDLTTLDPVIFDATEKMEAKNSCRYDVVITLQPTSPTLKPATLSAALSYFCSNPGVDTIISAVNRPHLSWSKNENGFFPLYEKRLNRQMLPPNYLEAGAFVLSAREFVTQNSRLGKHIEVFEISEEEAVDIDNKNDWILAEAILSKKKIIFRADGHKMLGMGHIYHCMTLAYNLTGHEIMFVSNENGIEGIEKLKNSFLPLKTIKNDDEFFELLQEYKADIVVNDCLDTTVEYIKRLKTLTERVVTIEDIGEGARYADMVINALYEEPETNQGNVFSGEKYVCLRDEFILASPKEFSKEVRNITVLFGGTDPSNLTKLVYDMAGSITAQHKNIRFSFITGIGYDCVEHGIVSSVGKNIEVISDSRFISQILKESDLALTSQGRTVYELASLGVPSIVLAQNEREQKHTFAQMKNGFLNMGLGSSVEPEAVKNTVEWLINTPQIRKEMRTNMLSHDLKSSVKREINLILGYI